MEDILKRSTMIKPQVGKVKTSSYDLPSNGFVYGRPSRHEESVGDIISKVSVSHPHEHKAKKNFISHPSHPHRDHASPKHHEPATDVVFGKKTQL